MSHIKYHHLAVGFTIQQAYVNHLCHHTTRRGHHKHDVSPYNQFKGGRPTGNLDIWQCNPIFACEEYHTSGNSLPVGRGVQSRYIVMETVMDMVLCF
jgi:hypothetical protein